MSDPKRHIQPNQYTDTKWCSGYNTAWAEAQIDLDKKNAEIDRLRAERDGQREENARLRKSIEDNLERLGAENAELRELLRVCRITARRGTATAIDAILAKTTKADSAAQNDDSIAQDET